MQRTRVKICGVMRPEDASAASAAGADAVGMIFHPPSKRNIPIERARGIVAAVGPFVAPVGVFVDAPTQQIIQTAGAIGLRTVQLHGRERAQQVAELAAAGLAVLKAIRVDDAFEAELDYWRSQRPPLAGIVLETAESRESGGTGLPNDFQRIRACQDRRLFEGLPPIIVAGGLRVETVRSVVEMLRPWAVDVSTGVESATGVKDHAMIRAFIHEARSPG